MLQEEETGEKFIYLVKQIEGLAFFFRTAMEFLRNLAQMVAGIVAQLC